MKKTDYLKWILGGVLSVLIVGLTIIYSWSMLIMHKTYDVPLTTISIPSDVVAIREGARLIRIEHCRSCHGEQFEGKRFQHTPYRADQVAPNITALIATYSNEELERLIRHGVKKNGKSVFGMPSQMFFNLKDESVANIIAYLRTLKPIPPSPDLPASSTIYPLGRWDIITGKYLGSAARINHLAPRHLAQHDSSQLAFGKYLAMTVCSSCHGGNLQGQGHAPNMSIAGAYSNVQFIHFLKTGEGALGRKELLVMSALAKNHLSYLNANEMNAIYTFLKSLSAPMKLAKK
jgi:mono/diheme cytochrome c family protein